MSFSQFDSPNQNPYTQPTQTWPANASQPSAQQPNGGTSQFTLLGIFFIIVSVTGLGFSVLNLIAQVATYYSKGMAMPRPDANDAQRIGFYLGYYGNTVALTFSGLVQPFVAWAGINIIRKQGLGIAKVGAILLCIPCLSSCCFLGIPFGIWGVIALNSNAAKRWFS